MLDALEEQWRQAPPVHLLVRAFLGYQPPAVQTPAQREADDGTPPPWLQGMGAIPGPQAARDATTPEAAMAAFEAHFFGKIHDVSEL